MHTLKKRTSIKSEAILLGLNFFIETVKKNTPPLEIQPESGELIKREKPSS
jgi:hypothetical protein